MFKAIGCECSVPFYQPKKSSEKIMKKPTSQKTVATQIFWSEFRKVFYPVPKQLGTLTHARQKRCNEQWPCKAAKDTSKAACPAPQTSQLMMFFCLDDLKHRSIWACKKNISKYIYIIIYIYHIYIYISYISIIYIYIYISLSLYIYIYVRVIPTQHCEQDLNVLMKGRMIWIRTVHGWQKSSGSVEMNHL